MSTTPHRPFPPLPNIGTSRNLNSQSVFPENLASSSSQLPLGGSYQIGDMMRYMSDLDNAIRSRMEEYEKNQKEILLALGRERIIEESTRRLLHINFVLCICCPLIVVFIFFLFCFSYAPENVKNFFEEYKIIFSFFSIFSLGAASWPIFHLHNYNKRLDAIEKKLKLNGNV